METQVFNPNSVIFALEQLVSQFEQRIQSLDSAKALGATIVMHQFYVKHHGQAKHALDRVLAGKYGICERCSKTIESRRLKFRLTVTTCLACT